MCSEIYNKIIMKCYDPWVTNSGEKVVDFWEHNGLHYRGSTEVKLLTLCKAKGYRVE